MKKLQIFGLHVLTTVLVHAEIISLATSNITEDRLQWPKRSKRTSPAVWGAPVPNFSNIVLTGPSVYLYTILFIDLKTVEYYENDMKRVTNEVVKLARESNKYFYQLNIRLVVADVIATNRHDLSLYSFEDFHNRLNGNLPYHDFAVLINFRYAGGLAFVSGFCSSKNVMMVGFYPHNPSAMSSIFFHETCHLIGVSHTHSNETLDVPNCPCNSVTYVPKSEAQHSNITGESLLSSSSRYIEGCLKIPGFDHNCTAQLAVNLLHRSRCLSNIHRSEAFNRAEGYTTKPKAMLELLSICGNGVIEGEEECDCGLSNYCTELNCEPTTCERKIAIWILSLGGASLLLVIALILYVRIRIALHYKKRYLAVNTNTKMLSPEISDYTATLIGVINQLNRLFRAIKSALCRRNQRAREENVYISTKTKLDTNSIVVIRSAQQLPEIVHKGPAKIAKRPQFAPPPLPTASVHRPSKPPPPRPKAPELEIMRTYGHLETNITYKFADFDDDD